LDLRPVGSVTLWCSSASPVFHSKILPAGCLWAVVSRSDDRRPYFSARFPRHLASRVCILVRDLLPCSASVETISAPRFSSPAQGVRRAVFLFPPRSAGPAQHFSSRGLRCSTLSACSCVSQYFFSPASSQSSCRSVRVLCWVIFHLADFSAHKLLPGARLLLVRCLLLVSQFVRLASALVPRYVPACMRLLLTVELFSVDFGFRFSVMCGMIAGEAPVLFLSCRIKKLEVL
jgi:hypothetical protein